MQDQKSLVNELAVEFTNSILSSANHNKEVLGSLEIDVPDKDMLFINLVLWESWMFFMALGKVNPPQGEQLLNKTLIQVGSSLQKITMERLSYLAQQLYPIFSQAYAESDKTELSTIISQMLFGEEIIIEGFQDYVEKLTATTIDSYHNTIQNIFKA
jgi:hypothetical protein